MHRNLVLASVLVSMTAATPVVAQNSPFTWVSTKGDDRNDCSFYRPCRSLQRAHD
jgi:hypothetical protein